MAEIKASSDEKVFRIQEFFGLNENADGDTKLKLGEASSMRNFKITRDHSLQKRPGLSSIGTMTNGYSIKISDNSKIVHTDNNVSSQLAMYPNISLNPDNSFEAYGNKVTVDYENSSMYSGYFWTGNDGKVYQLDRCEQKIENTDTKYNWYMRQLSVVLAGEGIAVTNALWTGTLSKRQVLLGVAGSNLCLVWDSINGFVFRSLGTLKLDDNRNDQRVSIFGFADKVYIMTGLAFYVWEDYNQDISELTYLTTYQPLVMVSVTPSDSSDGSGVALQPVNLLSSYYRVWLSPDGKGKEFTIPANETAPKSYYKIKNLVYGTFYDESEFNLLDGGGTTTIQFNNIPNLAGENIIEVTYPGKGYEYTGSPFDAASGSIPNMKYVETYNGATDARIFLYGDGTNRTFYSDFDTNGLPRADYIPELNVINIGVMNTPVTGLVRHYSRLIAFKGNEAYSIQYGTITLPDNTSTAAFYCTPINRSLGNEAMGQVRLVLNSPYTLCGKDLYEWRNNSSYSSNLTIDERQAKRISDRVYATLANFDFSRCYCYDDNDHQEYYICYDKKALVYNYAADAWYYYTNFDVTCMVNLNGELYAGDSLGRLNLVSRNNRTDNGDEITGYWESGAEPFDREFMRKYSAMLWVVLKPELRSQVMVTVETDRKSDHSKKVAASSVFSFGSADFRRWSFNTNRKPHTTRLKIKAKKFTYYKLILEYSGTNTTATVVAADMRIRYTGYAK